MKRTLNLLTLFTIAFVLTLGINTLYAGQGPGHGTHMMGPGGDDDGPCMMMDRDQLNQVGLTTDQKAKIEALNSENQKATITKQSEMKVLRVDLKTEMDKDTIDIAKISELADKISKARAELTKMKIMHAAQVANIMTKEQRTQLGQLRVERRQMMMERFKGKPGKDHMKEKE
ncbi:MAG: periplasmic heavy metal sensor [Proteobacteria bacterium]|nr:periplasmic heavy metal sensor [Pseudomonadota bacterium]